MHSNRPIILYVCDRLKCGDNCSHPTCLHTTDINHAKNFERCQGKHIIKEVESNGQGN